MSETNRLPPSFPDHPVWAQLSHYVIGPEDAALPLAARRLIEDPKARRAHPRDAFIIPKTTARLLLFLAGAAVGIGIIAHVQFW